MGVVLLPSDEQEPGSVERLHSCHALRLIKEQESVWTEQRNSHGVHCDSKGLLIEEKTCCLLIWPSFISNRCDCQVTRSDMSGRRQHMFSVNDCQPFNCAHGACNEVHLYQQPMLAGCPFGTCVVQVPFPSGNQKTGQDSDTGHCR